MPPFLAAMLVSSLVGCKGGDDPDAPREGDDAGECEDGADNDVDGDFDCDDSDCAGSPVCDDGETGDTGDGCVAPEITEISAEAHDGLIDIEGTMYAAVDVHISVTAEASLEAATGLWWRDAMVDGDVGTFEEGGSFGPLTDADGYVISIAVDGGTLEFETTYEFALQLFDAEGCSSNRAVVAGTTPDAKGG